MQGSFRIGRLLGIPIALHYSWILIALLITFSLAGHFAVTQPDWSGTLLWAVALTTSALFFFSLVLHELSHAVVARASGLPVDSITLFALGGVARIRRDAMSPGAEFRIAVVGPLTSVAIAGLCLLGARLADGGVDGAAPLSAMLGWLGYINFVLAGFNLLPGFPLDGGRILRAIIWKATGSADRATRLAGRVGQAMAVILIALGLSAVLAMGNFGGLWLALLGWFLLQAATASQAQLVVARELRRVRVGDVMSRDCAIVDPDTPLDRFVDEVLLRTGRRCFVAERDGGIHGLITPADVRRVERERWPALAVRDVMRPATEVRSVTPDASAADALEIMAEEDLNQLPVVVAGHLEGVVSRGHILSILQRRAELAGAV